MSKARKLADLGNVYDDGALSHRNLIINGAMQISQRGTTFTGLANGTYGLDRFSVTHITDGSGDVKQTSDGPVSNTDGVTFTKCLHVDVATADTSVSASNMYAIIQGMEYLNVKHLGFGKSGTRYVTASFWVKSTKTGTFCCFLKSHNHQRGCAKEYTVSSSDTWEHKTVTFPVDTVSNSGWTDNNGLQLGWTLYGGTNYHLTEGTWTATTNNYAPCTSNQVNAFDSASNNFKITGVQLEAGDTATPFEHRSYGDELARCQRYYFKSDEADSFISAMDVTSGSAYYFTIMNPTTMRTGPTITLINESNSKFDGITVFRNYATRWGGYDVATGSGRGYWQFEYEADAEL
jgi:hypothetical protein